MMQELFPGGNIKLLAAVEQVGECQEQTDLVGEGTGMGNPAHGETHGQDGEEPGNEGSAAQEGELTAIDSWVNRIIELKKVGKCKDNSRLIESGFEINNCAQKLDLYYRKMIGSRK